MSRFFIALQAILLLSCSSSVEDRIGKAVEKIEKERILAKGEKLEFISIDSVRITPGSMAEFYLNAAARQLASQQNGADNAVMNVNVGSIRQIETNYVRLKLMAETADTTRNIHVVDYWLRAETDKNRYQLPDRRYFSKERLEEIILEPALLKN